MSKQIMKLVDKDGENRAVRMFLMLYGGQCSVTTDQMRKHLEMSGFKGAWPDWAAFDMHLSKAGAQLWIRHLFNLEQSICHPEQPEPLPVKTYSGGKAWHVAPTQPLTEEQIKTIVAANTTDDHGYDIWCDGYGVARAIEAAHGITKDQK